MWTNLLLWRRPELLCPGPHVRRSGADLLRSGPGPRARFLLCSGPRACRSELLRSRCSDLRCSRRSLLWREQRLW